MYIYHPWEGINTCSTEAGESGPDMAYRDGRVVTDHTKRARTDQSLKGIKKMAREDPERAAKVADEIIRNTYRTLMTRGMKDCYVWCADEALGEYLKRKAGRKTVPVEGRTTGTG